MISNEGDHDRAVPGASRKALYINSKSKGNPEHITFLGKAFCSPNEAVVSRDVLPGPTAVP